MSQENKREFCPFNPFTVHTQVPEQVSESVAQVSDMSNYFKVLEFNKAFGVKTNTTPQLNIFDNDPKLIRYRLDLITEEANELKDAIEQRNFTETIDALADLLVVVYGAFTAIGVNANDSFDIVHKSNMSKLCTSEENAKETVEWYLEHEKERYKTPKYRKADDNIHWVVYNESTMKILKNINYIPANFKTQL